MKLKAIFLVTSFAVVSCAPAAASIQDETIRDLTMQSCEIEADIVRILYDKVQIGQAKEMRVFLANKRGEVAEEQRQGYLRGLERAVKGWYDSREEAYYESFNHCLEREGL